MTKMEPSAASLGEQLILLWTRDGLKLWPARALQDVAIPESSKRLLTGYGLPELWPRSERLLSDVEELPRLDAARPHYRVIAVTAGAGSLLPRWCLDEQRDGRILSIFLADAGRRQEVWSSGGLSFGRPEAWDEVLINTRVERFAAFLILYRKLLDAAGSLSHRLPDRPSREELSRYEAEVLPVVDETEHAMRRADPEAMEGEESQWPGLLAEFREHTMWDLE